MDDEKEGGDESTAITKPIAATNPMAVTTNPTIIEIPPAPPRKMWIARYPKFSITIAGIIVFVGFLAQLLQIPNTVANWFLNARQLRNKPIPVVPGTEIPYTRLDGIFPYGYALVFCSDTKPPFRYEVYTNSNSLITWDVDWQNVVIERDVAAMRINLKIPARVGGGTIHISAPNGGFTEFGFAAMLKTGAMARGPVYFQNRPVPYVLTLSDNQRNPVFAVGFRITTAEEPGARGK